MRSAGMSTARIEAYRVGTGYHEGAGQSMEGWLDETEHWRAYVKGLREARVAAKTAGDGATEEGDAA